MIIHAFGLIFMDYQAKTISFKSQIELFDQTVEISSHHHIIGSFATNLDLKWTISTDLAFTLRNIHVYNIVSLFSLYNSIVSSSH